MFRAQLLRDPVHNLIAFAPNEFESVIWKVIQTRPFQRLRRVKQLGFSDMVYPGATHSRLAHSIGVFHTARQLMGIIHEKIGDRGWSASQANTALAAALVHDVGHGPFSHAFEEVGKRLSLKMAHHEHVSDILIRESDIANHLRDLGSGFHNDVANVIKSAGPRSVYDAVVSSQFDADRLDYIRRDRMMAGSSHGVIDYDWLVSSLQVESINIGVDETKVSELETFVIGPKGIYAAEAYVLGLFQLYPTIYLHKVTRGVEKLFTELIVRVFELAIDGSHGKTGLPLNHPLIAFAKDPDSIDAVLCLDDSVIYGALSQMCSASDKTISTLSLRIRDRKLFKCYDLREEIKRRVLERGVDQDQGLDRTVSRIVLSASEKIELWNKTESKTLLLKDEARRPPYRRFEESKGPLNQIMVRNSNGSLSDLGEYSPIVASIPTFEANRYYYDRDEGICDDMLNTILDEEIKI